MDETVRLSISLDESLFERLDRLVQDHGYSNRSEFVRDMIRDKLVEKEWEENRDVVGTITLVYNHHARKLSEKLTSLQHSHHDSILATTHVHLDEHMCAEMILVKGKGSMVKKISDMLRRQKGILHATLSMSTLGSEIH